MPWSWWHTQMRGFASCMPLWVHICTLCKQHRGAERLIFWPFAGTDALVNAILVARGDSLPTEFAAERLEINPKLPFLGSSAYHVSNTFPWHKNTPQSFTANIYLQHYSKTHMLTLYRLLAEHRDCLEVAYAFALALNSSVFVTSGL